MQGPCHRGAATVGRVARFPIRFAGANRAMCVLGLTPRSSYVEVTSTQLVRMGWAFRATGPLASVRSVGRRPRASVGLGSAWLAGRVARQRVVDRDRASRTRSSRPGGHARVPGAVAGAAGRRGGPGRPPARPPSQPYADRRLAAARSAAPGTRHRHTPAGLRLEHRQVSLQGEESLCVAVGGRGVGVGALHGQPAVELVGVQHSVPPARGRGRVGSELEDVPGGELLGQDPAPPGVLVDPPMGCVPSRPVLGGRAT
jgi:hypothetical protein